MMLLRKRRVVQVAILAALGVLALALLVSDKDALRYALTWDPTPSSLRDAPPQAAAPDGSPVASPGRAGTGAGTDFFLDFRLDRERTRSQQLEQLREIINNTKVDEATRRTAAAHWLEITTQIGKELELEGLIKAKGWGDCIVFVQDGACTVVVKADKLAQAEAAKIGDIVVRGTGLSPKDITISARTR